VRQIAVNTESKLQNMLQRGNRGPGAQACLMAIQNG